MDFLDKHIGADGRKYDRFSFKDLSLWSLWLNHQSIEPAWVQDLNSVGMKTYIKNEAAPLLDEEIQIQILLNGRRIITCEAKVKWRGEVKGRPELASLGLEFVDPFYRVAKAWQEANLRSYLSKCA